MTTVRKWYDLQPITKLAIRLGVMLVAAIIVITGLVFSLYAVANSNSTANCVNDALGKRVGAASSDANAHKRFATDLLSAYGGTLTRAQFTARVEAYAKTLAANQAYRDDHPLGRC